MTDAISETPKAAACYRLYGHGDELLYVGSTLRPENRFRQHSTDKAWWPEVARRDIAWFGSELEAREAEAVAIKQERPRYNVVTPGVYKPYVPEPGRPDAAGENNELRAAHEAHLAFIRETADRDILLAHKMIRDYEREIEHMRSVAAALRREGVRRMRDEQNLSLRAIAERLGVTKGTAQQILDGKPRQRRKRDGA